MANHTPGPWRLGDKSPDGHHIEIDADTHVALATVVWRLTTDDGPQEHSPEMEANARLIAEAPSLLGALKTAEAALLEFRHAVDRGHQYWGETPEAQRKMQDHIRHWLTKGIKASSEAIAKADAT